MQRLRYLVKQRHIACLLLLGITLRSLIAVGFMLDTQADDGLFSITLCDGPAGINSINLDDEHAHHHHHHADHEDHQSASAQHDMSACHIWSASAQSVSFHDQFLLQTNLHRHEIIGIENRSLYASRLLYTTQARAPPVIS